MDTVSQHWMLPLFPSNLYAIDSILNSSLLIYFKQIFIPSGGFLQLELMTGRLCVRTQRASHGCVNSTSVIEWAPASQFHMYGKSLIFQYTNSILAVECGKFPTGHQWIKANDGQVYTYKCMYISECCAYCSILEYASLFQHILHLPQACPTDALTH